MKPIPYILSLSITTVGIVGLQVALPDALAVMCFWAAVVISTYSAGWPASKYQKTLAVLTASIIAVYLIPTGPMQSGDTDHLYLFKLSWFILPVWILLLIHSGSRIRWFLKKEANQPPQTTRAFGPRA